MRALLVVNPRAGRVRGPAGVARIVAALEAAGLAVEPIVPPSRETVPDLLRAALRDRDPADTRVVVAGGDGSIHVVLPAVMNTPFPLAVLPVGSVNVIAREFGLPRDLLSAAQLAARGRVRPIDLGRADGRPFALTLGVGFDAAVVHSIRPAVKRVIGAGAYVANGLVLLARHRASHYRIVVDEEAFELEAWMAIITNLPRYTYHWRICPMAEPDDGWLDLCLFQADSLAQRIRQVRAVLAGCHVDFPGVRLYRARHFRFECTPPAQVQIDGDPAGFTPTDVTVAPQALHLVVPE